MAQLHANHIQRLNLAPQHLIPGLILAAPMPPYPLIDCLRDSLLYRLFDGEPLNLQSSSVPALLGNLLDGEQLLRASRGAILRLERQVQRRDMARNLLSSDRVKVLKQAGQLLDRQRRRMRLCRQALEKPVRIESALQHSTHAPGTYRSVKAIISAGSSSNLSGSTALMGVRSPSSTASGLSTTPSEFSAMRMSVTRGCVCVLLSEREGEGSRREKDRALCSSAAARRREEEREDEMPAGGVVPSAGVEDAGGVAVAGAGGGVSVDMVFESGLAFSAARYPGVLSAYYSMVIGFC